MKIAVIDGQGGGIGKRIVETLKEHLKDGAEVICLGTNSLATSNMLKAGADSGATGENAIRVMCRKSDIIIGPIAIVMANSMMGEITPVMAESIADSSARKILLPLNRCNIQIVGTKDFKMSDMINSIIDELEL